MTAFPQTHKTALDYFDDMHDDRIEKADQIPIDLSVLHHHHHDESIITSSEAHHGHLENKAVQGQQQTGIDTTSSLLLPPIVDLEYLNELYDDSSVDSSDERQELFQLVQSRGGCCLVRFRSDSKYATVLKSMWRAMEEFYQHQVDTTITTTTTITENTIDPTLKDENNPVLMRQHLTRPEQSPNAGGYDFVQTYWDQETKRVVPTTIQDSLGWDHPFASSSIEDSFHALLELSKLFTIVLSSGGLQRPIEQMESLLNNKILDDFGCCNNHRLCQYRPLMTTNDNNNTNGDESAPLLRSHTDWSLVTCIPVSPTPGLLTFDPLHQKWLAPDTVITSRVGGDEATSADDECHYSQYCLMMTGKSMDMLLGVQGGMACIHQVVPALFRKHHDHHPAPPKRRLSAPFFLRPKESVSVQINEECNSKPCASQQQGIAKLHQVYCCELATTTGT